MQKLIEWDFQGGVGSSVKLTEVVHAPVTVVVPPVSVIRGHGHTVLPLASVRLAGQVVLAPLEVGDARAVLEQVEPFRALVVDPQPHRPVPRVEEGFGVVGQGLLLLPVPRHGHPAAPLLAQLRCPGI
ncbi:hypothetical protein ANANG_G00116980 [Anguilla anguilla]|uniref:Uncharacterized protein n=1 Tax=Anguilla anguilla TaxID=7936 RepID=A0A9D3S185_ANGAN|nr:hypothetical protein ANANG_G00116980 [Anguilla anguilla]